MRAYGSVGTLLGVTIAVCALGCKQDLTTGQGGTGGGVGTTGAGGAAQSTGGNTGGNTQSAGGNTGGSTLSTGGVGGTTTSTGGVGGAGGVGGIGGAAGHPVSAVPSQHRPTATVCSDAGAPLSGYDGGLRGPTTDASITGTIRCTTANTCPACSNGLPDRCVFGGGGGGSGSNCACDECVSDQDCGPKGVCSCGTLGGNVCLSGNCRVDSDCGPGGYCSLSAPRYCGGGGQGYYCHTAQDQCRADADCQGVGSSCTYSPEAAIWTCATAHCGG